MRDVLLSIVVPTKNRESYLRSLIDIYCDFPPGPIELVIQDNSETRNLISEYIQEKNNDTIYYYYDGSPMPIIDNSTLAVLHSNGEYVCFMGDDDLLSHRIIEFTLMMKRFGYECACFKTATYSWPGLSYKVHKFPSLVIEKYHKKIQHVCPSKERHKLMKKGAVALGKMPQLYHGIVKRSCLNKIYEMCGTFFPGPSPDMAVAVALSYVVNNIIHTDIPLITSGKCPNSGAGLGAKHLHKGNLDEMSFLPKDIVEKWNKKLPEVWTGPTIYGQSLYESVGAMDRSNDICDFNYSYFYAYFFVFCSDNSKYLRKVLQEASLFHKIRFFFQIPRVFFLRVRKFIENRLILRFRFGADLFDNIPNSYEAEKTIDSLISKIDIKSLFDDLEERR